jgi:glutamine phosphoribosylpyrophosphate amidotransferase
MHSVEAIREYIKADSLDYLSHDGMMAAVDEGVTKVGEDGAPIAGGHCSACMTGEYPVVFDVDPA